MATMILNLGISITRVALSAFENIRALNGSVKPISGQESTTAMFIAEDTSALEIQLSGHGFTYSNGVLTGGTVTGLTGFPADSSYVAFTLQGFAGISAEEMMAILNGSNAGFFNLIQSNQWDYTGSGGDDDFAAGELSDNLSSGMGDDTLYGGGGNDTIDGGADNDILYGGNGNDKIIGGTGTDTMYGGAGNDTFYVNSNFDKVRENAGGGSDTVVSANTFTLHASAEIENLRTIDSAATGSYVLTGNDFSQNITGNAGHNRLIGLGGNDGLSGGSGNDRLYGGSGNDTLRGGNGADIFVFNTALSGSTNSDTILDFSATADTIWLDNAIFTAVGANGGLSSVAFRIGTAAADASDRVIYNSSTGALIYDSNGSASGGAVQFAKLATGLALTNADFFII
ncbi:calcium-binding protein [Sinorhizobium sp. RAC02]|uniref:calcium-binding protein n=1 Tax=Sinorhizobium sp. RAC02 TaxID=1842534 RepID=UPI00083CC42F|nr:calcium-binding protein [Sinorhizobium sp. RAC02]AOF90924.1 hemolysin-type calcium-binding repeat family protein [Sinorhizobium sp. RAC02]